MFLNHAFNKKAGKREYEEKIVDKKRIGVHPGGSAGDGCGADAWDRYDFSGRS